jgi:hypothetical protein
MGSGTSVAQRASGLRASHVAIVAVVLGLVVVVSSRAPSGRQPTVRPSSAASVQASHRPKPSVSPSRDKPDYVVLKVTWNRQLTVNSGYVEIYYDVGGVVSPRGPFYRLTPPWQSAKIPYDGKSKVYLRVDALSYNQSMWVACEIFHYKHGDPPVVTYKKPAAALTSPQTLALIVMECGIGSPTRLLSPKL